MFKKFSVILTLIFLSFIFRKNIYADIFINKTLDEPIYGAEDYDKFVRNVLYNTNFKMTNNDVNFSSYEIEFNNNNFKIIYKDREKTNYFTGDFAIGASKLYLMVNNYYQSDKFGFYSVQDFTNKPIEIDNSLNIGEKDTAITLSSKFFNNLNITIYPDKSESNNLALEDDYDILDNNIFRNFTSKPYWKINNSSTYNFDFIYFYNKEKLYLINEKNEIKVTILEAFYDYENGNLLIKPIKLTSINKISAFITEHSFKQKEMDYFSPEIKYYYDDLNLVFKLYHSEKTNSYYIKDNSEKGIEKLSSSDISNFNINFESLTISQIENNFINKSFEIKLSENDEKVLNLNLLSNSDFEGRFLIDGFEYILKGKYKITQGRMDLIFKVSSYFNLQSKNNIFYTLDENKDFKMSIPFYEYNKNIFSSIIESNFDNYSVNENEKMYSKVNFGILQNKKAEPIDINDKELIELIKNKKFSFSLDNKIGGPTYNLQFEEDAKVTIYIENDSSLEIIKSTYLIKNGEIRIINNNRNYAFGNYDKYEYGKKINYNNKFDALVLFVKYDSTNSDLYFAIYDGRQYINTRENDDNYKKIIKDSGYYKANKIASKSLFPDLTDISSNNLESFIAGKTFYLNYGKNSERFTFKRNGLVNVMAKKNNGDIEKIYGKYNIVQNLIVIEYDKIHLSDTNQYYYEINKTDSIIFNIQQDKNNNKYYIKIEDGIYLNFKETFSEVSLKEPRELSEIEIYNFIKNKKIVFSNSKEKFELTFNNETFTKNSQSGKYKIENSTIKLIFNNGLEEVYKIKFDDNFLYFSLNNDKYFIININKMENI